MLALHGCVTIHEARNQYLNDTLLGDCKHACAVNSHRLCDAVLSTALFDKPPFKNLVVNGLVLAEDGKKMSKRLKNYPDPNKVGPDC